MKAQAKTFTVLLIADDPVFTSAVAEALRDQPCKLVSVRCSETALKVKNLSEPEDLVILDMEAPALGIDAFRVVQEFESGTPIVVAIAPGEHYMAAVALAQGALEIITKPVDPEQLRLVIERLLGMESLGACPIDPQANW